ncbi:unnamed protein product [Caenorhabditis angaria]|uniref:Uncharacterized protein n=1 Tax=Caenorhabditis angaria TaxID=860376 RepID=A0A9P1IST6_9PELO|nr:unnamed protein product [Caenorhabditis angaria]
MDFKEFLLLRSFYVLYHVILLTIYILSVFTIFPIFIHLTRINRQKDRESSVFLITNHIYKITIYSQIMIVSSAISVLIFLSIPMLFSIETLEKEAEPEAEIGILAIITAITFYPLTLVLLFVKLLSIPTIFFVRQFVIDYEVNLNGILDEKIENLENNLVLEQFECRGGSQYSSERYFIIDN